MSRGMPSVFMGFTTTISEISFPQLKRILLLWGALGLSAITAGAATGDTVTFDFPCRPLSA